MFKVFSGLFYFYIVLLWILGGLLHLWTSYIAYSIGGGFWGIVSFSFPVISQIIWGFKAWSISGFDSPYIQWLIVFAVMWAFHFVLAFFVTLVEEKLVKNIN